MKSRYSFWILIFTAAATILGAEAALSQDPAPDPATTTVDPWYRPSDSHILRLEKSKAAWPPVALPDPDAESATTPGSDPRASVELDLATQREKIIPSKAHAGETSSESQDGTLTAPPYSGLLPASTVLKTVIGIDDRAQITSTTSYPWRTIVKLFMTFPNGVQSVCSGAMIDNFHVLTAGHCLHNVSRGGWVTAVEVVPGLDVSPDFPQGTTASNFDAFYMPFYHAYATSLRSYSGWTNSQSPNHDWGVVTLDRNVGAFVGWMGRKTVNIIFGFPDGTYYDNGIFNTAGYPGDLSQWPHPAMYFDADNGCDSSTDRHWYFMDTAGGQSGSPVWEFNSSSGQRYIVSIHAYGAQSACSPGSNSGTRLNQDKFDQVSTWLADDSGSAPLDLPILIDDGQAFSGFSPQTGRAGETVIQLSSDVRNIGTAASGSFTVRYYASTNTFISTADHLLCSAVVPAINPFNWTNADCSAVIPAQLPAGDYYVGWIIDGDGLIAQKETLEDTYFKPASYGRLSVQSSMIFIDGFETGDLTAWSSF